MKVVKIIILIGAIINIAVWLDINIFLASVFLIIAITTLILLLKEYDTSDIEEKINDEIEKEKRLYNNIKENNEDIKYSKLDVDDLSKIGGIPIELLGRFSTITQLSGHTRESLRKIILNSKESALLSEKEKLALDDIILSWTDDYIDALATHALKLKAGARSIKKDHI